MRSLIVILAVILSLVSSFNLFSQTDQDGDRLGPYSAYQYNILTDSTRIPENRNRYIDANGVRSIYFVDIIKLDDPIVLNKKYTDRFFLIPAGTDLSKLNYKNILANNECYILQNDIGSFEWTMASYEENMRSWNWPKQYDEGSQGYYEMPEGDKINKGYEFYRYEKNPDCFLLILIQGKIFNMLYHDNVIIEWMDSRWHKEPIKFCNENAYYKMLIPLYELKKKK